MAHMLSTVHHILCMLLSVMLTFRQSNFTFLIYFDEYFLFLLEAATKFSLPNDFFKINAGCYTVRPPIQLI